MSLIRKSHEEAEKHNLSAITEHEAEETAQKVLAKFSEEYPKEVLALTKLMMVPAFLAGLPSFVLTRNMRDMHKLQNITRGRFLPIFPSFASPVLTTLLIQIKNQSRTLLEKDSCAICQEMNLSAMNVASGVILPTLFTIGMNIFVFKHMSIRGTPSLLSVGEHVDYFKKVFYRNRTFLVGLTLSQLFLSVFIVDRQRSEWRHVNESINEMAERGEI